MAELLREEGRFPAKDNLKLFWTSVLPQAPKVHLALVHGYADHIGRYARTMNYFAERGYGVHGFDCRGHGRSEGRRGHCSSFREYLDDFTSFLERVKVAAGGKKIFVLAHSHGALIAARYGLLQPEGISGMILTSPYFRLALRPSKLKVLAATIAGKIVPFLPVDNEIKSEQLTRDPAGVEAHRSDPLVNRVATPRWFSESNRAQDEVLEGAPRFQLPLGIFAGGADPIADAAAAQAFYERAGSVDKSIKIYPGALHEVMNETNRDEVLADIDGWLARRT